MREQHIKLAEFKPYAIVGVLCGVILVLALIGMSWFGWWLTEKPQDNYRICGERADNLKSLTWTSTGWRKDVCHVWKNGQETVIKL